MSAARATSQMRERPTPAPYRSCRQTGASYTRVMARHRFAPYDRLTRPLVREDGVLRPATWNDALARAATGLRTAIDAAGPSAVGFFSCSKSTNEANYLAQKLVRQAIGTNNIDSCNRT